MKQILQPFQAVLDRLAEFFFLFDLSFLVSGAAAFAALVLGWRLFEGPVLPLDGWLEVFAVLIACYLTGLICFAVGRWLRGRFPGEDEKSFDAELRKILAAHAIDRHPSFAPYVALADEGDSQALWRLYTRLWAETRDLIHRSPSWSLLQRYWVMAATYDGLSTALLVWAALIVAWMVVLGEGSRMVLLVGLTALAVIGVCVWACFHEAARLKRYQMEELAATVARLADPALVLGSFDQTE